MEQVLKARIESLALGGAGVTRVEGKVYFVRGALPGEEVSFRVTCDKPSYAEGSVQEVVSPSADRVEPACPYYGVCGGCQLQHLSYEKETLYKKQQVADTMSRIAGIPDVVCDDMVPSVSPYNYRSSITLHPSAEGYGYFRSSSKQVVRIGRCAIAEEAINTELPLSSDKKAGRDITLKADSAGRVWSSARYGERFFQDEIGGKKVMFSTRAFSQANREMSLRVAEKLDEWIASKGGADVLFDAYCGVGFFSFLMDTPFEKRIGMDSSRTAIDCAKATQKNTPDIDAKFYRGDAELELGDLIRKEKGKKNVVLVDPPRAGAGKRFLESISSMDGVGQFYYLSCDPARLARDVKTVAAGGKWRLGRVQPFDMFPRTRHIEVLAEFVK